MHKKYTKFIHEEHRHRSSSRRAKSGKEYEENILEVPQNSRSEINKKFNHGDYEEKENSKSKKDKHKHRNKSEEAKSNVHHSRNKREKKLVCDISEVQGLVSYDEAVRHKEKKDKNDKDRLNKIEKYLEGLNKVTKMSRQRSLSLESSKLSVKNKDKRFRREKTFQDKLKREESTNSRTDEIDLTTNKEKKSSRKHKESKRRKSSKDNQKETMYCHIEQQSPFQHDVKQYNLEHIYPKESKKTKEKPRRRSSSRDSYSPAPNLEPTKSRKEKSREPKEKHTLRKSKHKIELKRNTKEDRSNASIAPAEKEVSRRKKKKHKHTEAAAETSHIEKYSEPKEPKKKSQKSKENQPKIEDDIKSYFTKIQTMIDKKLDFILGHSNNTAKETKEDEIKADKAKRKQEKENEAKALDQMHAHRDRSHSKRTKDYRNIEETTRAKHNENDISLQRLDEEKKLKQSEERKASKEKYLKKGTAASNICLKRERYPSEESEHHHKQQSSPQRKLPYQDPSVGQLINMMDMHKESKHHKRRKSPYNEITSRKISPDRLINMVEHPSKYSMESTTSLFKETITDEVKRKLNVTHQGVQHHHHRSLIRRKPIPGEDDFKMEELEPIYLLDAHAKKLKKRMRQAMNLQCKTVSIVGIPSQIRESTIFNQTQTTTSLTAINPVEDLMEKKKNSKRFKLYYKYSVANNKCQSDKSSDGKKSIISDSYRVVSDPSDNDVDVWKEKEEDKDSDAELAKILFVMKKEKQKNCGDTSSNAAVEHAPRKYKKRNGSPKPIALNLNNIVEEPSNISVTMHRNQSPKSMDTDVACTYFKTLKSSSSDCDAQLIKKCVKNQHKHKNSTTEKLLKEAKSRSSSRKRDDVQNKIIYPEKLESRNKKMRKLESHHKIKKKYVRDMYTSKSDINVSYDSLNKYKFSKAKPKSDAPSRFKEELKYLLQGLPARQPSADRKTIGMILKEELREIMKEMPLAAMFRKPSCDNLKETNTLTSKDEEVKTAPTTEVNQANIEDAEKKYCSKKIGTHPPMTRIPSLIKGYAVTSSTQSPKTVETVTSQSNIQETRGKQLVDAAIEVNTVEDKTDTLIEDKKLQVPSELEMKDIRSENKNLFVKEKVSAGVECDVKYKHAKHSKKLLIHSNVKGCQLVDPFLGPKVRCTCKATRPIINLENNDFPNRNNIQEFDSDAPPQYVKQRSSLSDGRTVLLESNSTDKFPNQLLLRRPATSEGKKCADAPKTPCSKNRRKRAKPNLTISTNVVSIDCPMHHEGQIQTSTLNVAKHQTRHNRSKSSCSEQSKQKSNLSSKTAVSLIDASSESRLASLVCIENFRNVKNFRSNSNSTSLDQYTSRALINDNPHNSTLFFTKNFSPLLNTYQRRKIYDEGIRRKMKKKNCGQNKMCSPVFEVRYLTFENEMSVSNQKCTNKPPTFNTKASKNKQKTKALTKKPKRFNPKNKDDACKFSGRDIFSPLISDVDQLNKARRKSFPEKNQIEEIFVNDDQNKDTTSEIQSSSLVLGKNSDKLNCSDCDNNKTDPGQDFKGLIDSLYNSIISYCNTKFKLPLEGVTKEVDSQCITKEKSYVILPKRPEENNSFTAPNPNTDSMKKNSSSEANICGQKHIMRLGSSVRCHLSCPVLAGSTSSFDYLYEDCSFDLNKEAVISHLKKPMKTILGYALNKNQVRKDALRKYPKKEDQVSNSATDSEESGYSSNTSKKYPSATSFFKRPSVTNLFKPVRKLEESFRSTSSLAESKYGPTSMDYDSMNQKCMEYAEKVREQTLHKDEVEEVFQEIPLNVLLLCRKSSTLLDTFNSKCSLCKKFSTPELPDITEGRESSNSMESLLKVRNSASVNLVKNSALQNSLTDCACDDTKLTKEMMEDPVVLSITNLNTCSLTIIEESEVQDEETDAQDNFSQVDLKSQQIDLDNRSDLSSVNGFRNYTSPSATSKFMAKKFFENLLKVYEKEIDLTNKLFRDDDFFVKVLLESVKPNELFKVKNAKSKTGVKERIKGFIGNVFSSKQHLELQRGGPGTHPNRFVDDHQRKLQILANNARKYFSMYVQAVKSNDDINDKIKICGLLKLLERIEDGDFAVLRKKEEVDFEEEIKEQVKEAFVSIYQVSVKEAKKSKRCLTADDLKLIRTFVSKYRIGLLSKTDLIATYIGRGVFKNEDQLKAAVTYLIQQNKDIDLKDFDERFNLLTNY